uniref:Uncharacterized protein n=1 Tax=Brassica oleracea var. oleracea TaxID=109376 RepID=A0A0D3D2X4_BRAOL
MAVSSIYGLEVHRRDLDFNGWIFCCLGFLEVGRHSSSAEQSWVFVSGSRNLCELRSFGCCREDVVLFTNIYIVDCWVDYGPVVFASHIEEGNTTISISAAPCDFPQQQRLTEVLTELVERHRKARAAVTNEMVDVFMAVIPLPKIPHVGFFSKTLSTNPRKNGRRTTVPDQSTGKEDPTVFLAYEDPIVSLVTINYDQDGLEANIFGDCVHASSLSRSYGSPFESLASTVELRLLRFWEARNVKKAGGSKHTGSMYAVSGFDITRSNLSFKLSDSPLSIRLGDLTAFFQITTPLAVANKTDEAVFVSFDGVITKLTNIGAAESGHIHDASIENPKDSQLPLLVTNLMGKTNTFHLRLTRFSCTSKHQTFTISRIFNEPNCPPVPDFFVDGGTGGTLNDMSGASSLTTKVCAVLTVDDNEPPGETIAGGASATDFLIPTSSKPTRKARLD